MAQVPYSEGVASVAPETRLPNDYQQIHADPSSFGGAIGQGLEKAGNAVTKTGEFFGQVAADNASNEYQANVDKILHGDPNARDENGQPVQGFLQLKGKAATDAWPGVAKQLEDERKRMGRAPRAARRAASPRPRRARARGRARG